MKTKTTVILGILVAGLVVTSFAFAGEGWGRGDGRGFRHPKGDGPAEGFGPGRLHQGGPGDGYFGVWMMERLRLTDAQKAKIEKISTDSKTAAEPLRSEVKTLREKVRAEWQKEKPSKNVILDLHKQISAANDKLAEQRISAKLEVIGVLTPAQRSEMLKIQAERGKRGGRGEGKGRWEGRRSGKKDGKGYGKRGPEKEHKFRPARRNA